MSIDDKCKHERIKEVGKISSGVDIPLYRCLDSCGNLLRDYVFGGLVPEKIISISRFDYFEEKGILIYDPRENMNPSFSPLK